MDFQRESPYEFSVEDLDKELISRGAREPNEKRFKFSDSMEIHERDEIMRQVKELYDTAKSWPRNEALRDISTEDLVKILLFKTGKIEIDGVRGTWGKDKRRDLFEIEDEQDAQKVKENVDCITAVLLKDSLIETNKKFSMLKVNNYGKAFNLCDYESFHDQPTAAGRVCTGFLVKEDVIATAGHCANIAKVTDLRFVFGFRMPDSSTTVTQVPDQNIYKGVEVIDKIHDRKGSMSDWALVKLDRNVVEQQAI